MVVAEGRLLGQWHDELVRGAPGRGLPPLAPNFEVLLIDERRPIAGQIRDFDRALADRPGVVLVPNAALDRYPADLQVIPWHLLIADEALRYANPATDARQALKLVRFGRWRTLASDRHTERQERRAPRRARRARGRRRGDDHRAAQHPRGRRSHGRDQRPPAPRQLRTPPGARHPPGHAGLDAAGPARQTARDRPRPRARGTARCDPPGEREAYRRLLEVLRELRTLEAGSELFKRALAELPSTRRRARERRRLRRRHG